MKTLIINTYYKQLITFSIYLKHLNLGVRYNHKIDLSLLPNLEVLHLTHCYSHRLDNLSHKFNISCVNLNFACI